MKILVAETQPTVPIGTFGPPLIEAGAELVYWRTPDEAPPASLDGFAGVVALGGAANPDQDAEYAWLNEERRLWQAPARTSRSSAVRGGRSRRQEPARAARRRDTVQSSASGARLPPLARLVSNTAPAALGTGSPASRSAQLA
jgi:hypothetical protein